MAGEGCNSFTPDTKVLMADGLHKPLAEVKVGDRVLATDPESGQTDTRTVSRVIVGEGQKNLVQIEVDTGGDAGSATESVTATEGHPFWLPDLGRWGKAGELHTGSMLQTSAGTWVKVGSVRKWTARERVYNLTVADIHTYYVQAGAAAVLNHNANETCQIEYGPFHRLESSSQPADVAALQEESGELWGRTPSWGAVPAVQAWGGPLPEGKRGIEFVTSVAPDPRSRPSAPTWRGPRPGVRVEEHGDHEFAKIPIRVTKNMQK